METSFLHLVASNNPPNPVELAAIQKEIDAYTEAASKLQDEKLKINERRRKLDAELWRLNSSIKTYQRLLSCMRRVPPEILGEIFKATLDPDDTIHIPPLVIILCLVCKSWRDAAIGTAGLWSQLQLNSKINGKPIRFAKVHNWLSRSGTLPRSLHLTVFRACDTVNLHPTTCEMFRSGLVQFLTNGPTLHRLSLFTSSPFCLAWLVNRMKKDAPATPRPWDKLECLGLTVTLNTLPANYLGSFIANLPMVTSFHIQEGGLYDYDTLPVDLAPHTRFLEMLTTLQIKDWPIAWMKTLLPLCKNLQSLKMDSLDHVIEDVQDAPSAPIILPQLRVFKLALFIDSEEAAVLPLLFRTPSLKEVTIDFGGTSGGDGSAGDLCEGLGLLLELSNANISHLQLSHISLPSESLRSLLLKIPSLNHITFHNVCLEAATFDPTALPSDAPLLPNLISLELFRLPRGFKHAKVCNYFARRVISGSAAATLKTLTMELAAGENVRDSAASVEMLRAVGADVLIYSRRPRAY